MSSIDYLHVRRFLQHRQFLVPRTRGAPGCMVLFTRYRLRPAMSRLREPIYESHHLRSTLRSLGKGCKRVSFNADSRDVIKLFDTVVGLFKSAASARTDGEELRPPSWSRHRLL